MWLRKPVASVFFAATLAVAVVGCGSSAHRRPAGRAVTPGLVIGAMADGPLFDPGVSLRGQLDFMVASGVESLRVAVDWSAAQPYRNQAAVPPARRARFADVNGVPTDFSQLDRIVGPATARGISILPVVEQTPAWDALRPGVRSSPPRSDAAYGAFLAALARRYGPGGSYWSAHPELHPLPIRLWQIWNEPDFTSYWSVQPFARSYVHLLAAARSGLRVVDPGAKIVLAGLPDFSWRYLAQIYRVAGASRLFDYVAVHPYTAEPGGVLIILRRVRAVMDRFGDRAKPMLATEISWPSSAGHAPDQFGIGTTEAGQATRLAEVIPLLAHDRAALGLAGFYWYTWIGDEGAGSHYAFDYAGLWKYVSGRIQAKPALAAYVRAALAAEGCRRKRVSARTCLS